MPILRAGPWGTSDDPYQPRPDIENENTRGFNTPDIGLYPVNEGNNIGYEVLYSANVQQCISPSKIKVTFPATDNFGFSFRDVVVTINAGSIGECDYSYVENPESYYRGDLFIMTFDDMLAEWTIRFGNEDFAQSDFITLDQIYDRENVFGVTVISGTTYYDGETITIEAV